RLRMQLDRAPGCLRLRLAVLAHVVALTDVHEAPAKVDVSPAQSRRFGGPRAVPEEEVQIGMVVRVREEAMRDARAGTRVEREPLAAEPLEDRIALRGVERVRLGVLPAFPLEADERIGQLELGPGILSRAKARPDPRLEGLQAVAVLRGVRESRRPRLLPHRPVRLSDAVAQAEPSVMAVDRATLVSLPSPSRHQSLLFGFRRSVPLPLPFLPRFPRLASRSRSTSTPAPLPA